MRRIPELDGLRAIAVALVLVHHLRFALESAPRVVGPMCLGVDLFFVLSGYLITGIILRNAGDARFYRNFYARRALRIWPIYYLVVAFCAAFGRSLIGEALPPDQLPYFLTYTQSPLLVDRLYFWLTHTWSLAVEEQFYLIWPPLVLLLGRRAVAPLAILAVVVAVASRAAGAHLFAIYARWDGLALGALIAVLLEGTDAAARARLGRRFLAGLALLGTYPLWRRGALQLLGPLLPASSRPSHAFALDLALFNAAVALVLGLLIVHSGKPWLAPLRNRVLGFLGLISYGIYLYHIPIFGMFGGTESLGVSLAALATTLAVAVASWFLIERPILGLKDRFEYRPGPRPSPAQPLPVGFAVPVEAHAS